MNSDQSLPEELDVSAEREAEALAGDQTTTVRQLREVVDRFVQDRHWKQFHSPKNVAMGIAIEAAELMEHLQWIDENASRQLVNNKEALAEIGEELADVICFCLALANELNLDVSQILREKMVKNRRKYPAEKSRGHYGPPQENS